MSNTKKANTAQASNLKKTLGGGPQTIPDSMTRRKPSPSNKTMGKKNQNGLLVTKKTQWIEDIPIAEMKLYMDNFRQVYEEFQALSELTTEILQSMGIILLKTLTPVAANGVITNRFTEFDDDDEMYEDDDEEQHMDEEGVYSQSLKDDVLEMQNLDDSNGGILVADV